MTDAAPQESAPPDTVQAFDPDLVEVDDGVHLLGAQCRSCERRSFPARDGCPWCGAATTRTRLADHGTVVSFTVVHLPLPFLDAPATIALVELADGVQVQGSVRAPSGEAAAPIAIGDPCQIAGLEVATPDGARMAYCFEVADA